MATYLAILILAVIVVFGLRMDRLEKRVKALEGKTDLED